ncbi:MAG: hypothetical protein NXI23_21460 [Bacteroidetes bacterium]|jgi:hypothetical protein|nr:hypothetical protein [Bacteroidota bacterium]MDF1866069.1 hypothetical protein [Saprospiraceae bacterium]
MKQNFTQNDLVRFIYKETSAGETIAIGEALNDNNVLYDQYETLLEGYIELPKVQFSPSPSAIQNVIGYNRQTTLETLY